MTYSKFIKEQTKRARKLNKEEEAVKLLILELSGLDGASFLANIDNEIDQNTIDMMTKKIDEYLIDGHPVQHIIGYSYFYGYKFIVNPNVLIPRPETEELVANILATYDDVFNGKEVNVVDVGTGSGAIAITLAKEEPKMKLWATDISQDALEVAKVNAKNNEVSVGFMCGDMLAPLLENNMKFDILVSNPPYICDNEYVEDIVLDNEPHVALFGGSDGMKFYDIILKDAEKLLNKPNIIAFEHSYSKGKEMLELANKYFPNGKAEIIKDLNGKDRIMIIVNE